MTWSDVFNVMAAKVYLEQARVRKEICSKYGMNELEVELLFAVGTTTEFPKGRDGGKEEASPGEIQVAYPTLHGPSISLYSEKLVKRGLLAKKEDAHDQRVKQLSLTDRGERVFSEVAEMYKQSLYNIKIEHINKGKEQLLR